MAIKEEIHLVGVDKTKRAFGSVQKSLGRLENNTRRLAGSFSRLQGIILGAVAAVGAFKVGKDFLNTAIEVENLAIQLKFLTCFCFFQDFSSEKSSSTSKLRAGAKIPFGGLKFLSPK